MDVKSYLEHRRHAYRFLNNGRKDSFGMEHVILRHLQAGDVMECRIRIECGYLGTGWIWFEGHF